MSGMKNTTQETRTVSQIENTDIFRENLKWIRDNNLQDTAKGRRMAELFNLSESSQGIVSDYISGRKTPSVPTLLTFVDRLRRDSSLPQITLDDLMFKRLEQAETYHVSDEEKKAYQFYMGQYILYYYDNSASKEREAEGDPETGLKYGFMKIYAPESTGEGNYCYRVTAVFGFKDAEGPEDIYALDCDKIIQDSIQALKSRRPDHLALPYYIYEGSFEILKDNCVLLMTCESRDKVLVIFQRPKIGPHREHYIGGVGTMNSITFGEEKVPCIQMLGIAQKDLRLNLPEVKKLLGFTPVHAKVEWEQAQGMYNRCMHLIKKKEKSQEERSEFYFDREDICFIIKGLMEKRVNQELDRHLFNYRKNTNDKKWYEMLKQVNEARVKAKKEENGGRGKK